MRLLSDKQIHNSLLYVAIVFLIIGFISLLYFRFDFVLGSISIVIACISIRVSIRSQWISDTSTTISNNSLLIAQRSDLRVKEISNSLFLGIVSSFEDRRLNIQLTPNIIHIALWKAFVDLQKADTMKRYSGINKEHFNTLGRRYNSLLLTIKKDRFKKILLCEDIRHILNMYKIIRKFKIDKTIIKEINYNLKELLDFEKGRFTISRIKKILNNINENNRWLTFKSKRSEIIN